MPQLAAHSLNQLFAQETGRVIELLSGFTIKVMPLQALYDDIFAAAAKKFRYLSVFPPGSTTPSM